LLGIVKSGGAVAAALALVVAAPAAAQLHSEGFKFLEAVEKKKGDEAIKMLSAPGSTIINARDVATNRTALHIVVERHDLTWLNFLLAKGADPNLADNRGVTPLLLACRLGFIEAVPALVKARARVDAANSAGETPLIFAVHSGNLDLVRALLKAGADPDRADNSGRTARDYARVERAQSTIVAELESNTKQAKARGGDAYGPSL
jgi:ankyrin repeat protein